MHKLVEQLTSAYAVSGDERCLHDILRSALDGIADEIHDTPLGNLIAVRKGRSSEHSILFAAHLDEVGAWVTRINDKGFLGIHCRSIDGRVWPGLQVVVHGTEPLPGIIGLKPVHVTSHDEMDKPVAPDELWIDVGLPRERVLTMVPIGSTVTFTAGISKLMNERFAGKTQDDRLCAMDDDLQSRPDAPVDRAAMDAEKTLVIDPCHPGAYLIEMCGEEDGVFT